VLTVFGIGYKFGAQPMRSLFARLLLAFAAVALVGVATVPSSPTA